MPLHQSQPLLTHQLSILRYSQESKDAHTIIIILNVRDKALPLIAYTTDFVLLTSDKNHPYSLARYEATPNSKSSATTFPTHSSIRMQPPDTRLENHPLHPLDYPLFAS